MLVQAQTAKNEKQRKYIYQTNWTAVISDVKYRTVLYFFRGNKQVEKIINSIRQSFRKIIEPILFGRQYPFQRGQLGI